MKPRVLFHFFLLKLFGAQIRHQNGLCDSDVTSESFQIKEVSLPSLFIEVLLRAKFVKSLFSIKRMFVLTEWKAN